MCNPIAQAKLLNQAKTEFNICLGLCVGHDSLFYRYCEAPAIYCADGYFSGRNSMEGEEK